MDTIKLKARYGYTHTLSHIKDNLWVFAPDSKSCSTFRIIGNPPNVEAFDPEGGPFMSVGGKIENYIIKSITSNGIFELIKDNENENS